MYSIPFYLSHSKNKNETFFSFFFKRKQLLRFSAAIMDKSSSVLIKNFFSNGFLCFESFYCRKMLCCRNRRNAFPKWMQLNWFPENNIIQINEWIFKRDFLQCQFWISWTLWTFVLSFIFIFFLFISIVHKEKSDFFYFSPLIRLYNYTWIANEDKSQTNRVISYRQ